MADHSLTAFLPFWPSLAHLSSQYYLLPGLHGRSQFGRLLSISRTPLSCLLTPVPGVAWLAWPITSGLAASSSCHSGAVAPHTCLLRTICCFQDCMADHSLAAFITVLAHLSSNSVPVVAWHCMADHKRFGRLKLLLVRRSRSHTCLLTQYLRLPGLHGRSQFGRLPAILAHLSSTTCCLACMADHSLAAFFSFLAHHCPVF